MKWLSENWLSVVLGIVAIAAVSGWVSYGRSLGAAEALRDEIARRTTEIDDARERLREGDEDRARRDSADAVERVRSEALRDSLRATSTALREATDSLRVVRRLETAAADSLEAEGLAAASRLGSVPGDLFRAYVRAVRSALSLATEEIAAAVATADAERERADEAERGELRERAAADRLRDGMAALQRFVGDLEARHETALEALDAYERAVAPSIFRRVWDNLELVVGTIVLAILGWELAT